MEGSIDDFAAMQLDLLDLRAVELVPQIVAQLQGSSEAQLVLACELLEEWDCQATVQSRAACIYYLFLGNLCLRLSYLDFLVRLSCL